MLYPLSYGRIHDCPAKPGPAMAGNYREESALILARSRTRCQKYVIPTDCKEWRNLHNKDADPSVSLRFTRDDTGCLHFTAFLDGQPLIAHKYAQNSGWTCCFCYIYTVFVPSMLDKLG